MRQRTLLALSFVPFVALAACAADSSTESGDLPSTTDPEATETTSEALLAGCPVTAVKAVTASNQEAGNPASAAIDGNAATRWASPDLGSTLTLDLGTAQPLCGVDLWFYRSNVRKTHFKIATSGDGKAFTQVLARDSSGTANGFETFGISGTARFVRVEIDGNTENDWASLLDVRVGATSTPVSTRTKPKVATLDYSWSTSKDWAARIAKYDYVILEKAHAIGPAGMNAFVNAVKAVNPKTILAEYTIFTELLCEKPANSQAPGWAEKPYWDSVIDDANAAGFWLRNAAGQRVRWTDAYGTCDINVTQWSGLDAKGRTPAQQRWAHEEAAYFGAGGGSKLDYLYIDNVFDREPNMMTVPSGTPTDANFKETSPATNQKANDAEIAASWRRAYHQYVDAAHAHNPHLKVIGNTNNDLSTPEFRGFLDGALNEALIGPNWSIEARAGWDAMMTRYRATLANTKGPKDVLFAMRGLANEYASMRYGLASAMLEDGYFLYDYDAASPAWFDEYDAAIGSPLAPAEKLASGAWIRKYTNGLVVVNPKGNATVTVDVTGYKRLAGKQDPGFNNGSTATKLTLAARSGALLLKQ